MTLIRNQERQTADTTLDTSRFNQSTLTITNAAFYYGFRILRINSIIKFIL